MHQPCRSAHQPAEDTGMPQNFWLIYKSANDTSTEGGKAFEGIELNGIIYYSVHVYLYFLYKKNHLNSFYIWLPLIIVTFQLEGTSFHFSL